MRVSGVALVLAASLLLATCGQDDRPAPQSAPADSIAAAPAGAADPTKGRHVWLAQCIACHNTDPTKDGPVGPAVKGSSRELLEARVLRATYPPGYKPKRDSTVMPARPDLAASIPDLTAYLH